jgi:hypothetical protein
MLQLAHEATRGERVGLTRTRNKESATPALLLCALLGRLLAPIFGLWARASVWTFLFECSLLLVPREKWVGDWQEVPARSAVCSVSLDITLRCLLGHSLEALAPRGGGAKGFEAQTYRKPHVGKATANWSHERVGVVPIVAFG